MSDWVARVCLLLIDLTVMARLIVRRSPIDEADGANFDTVDVRRIGSSNSTKPKAEPPFLGGYDLLLGQLRAFHGALVPARCVDSGDS